MLPISITGLVSVLLSLSSVAATLGEGELTRPCKAKLAPERLSSDAVPLLGPDDLSISAATLDDIRNDCDSTWSRDGPGNDLDDPRTDEYVMQLLAAGTAAFRPSGGILDRAQTGQYTKEDISYIEAMGDVVNTKENRHLRKLKGMVSKLDTEGAKKWVKRIVLAIMDRLAPLPGGTGSVIVGAFKIIYALTNVYTVSLGLMVMFIVLLSQVAVGTGGTLGLIGGAVGSLFIFVAACMAGKR